MALLGAGNDPKPPAVPVIPKAPLSYDDWLKTQPGIGVFGNGKQDYLKPLYEQQYGTYADPLNKAKEKYDLNTNYATAQGALQPAASADIAEYQRTSPLAQRRLLGGLNARGLGSSVAAGGSGSGAIGELSNRQQSGLYNIQSGYQSLANQLDKQKAGDAINLDSFYQSIARQRELARQLSQQNTANPLDFAQLPLSTLSFA